jgi:hypothetical protein
VITQQQIDKITKRVVEINLQLGEAYRSGRRKAEIPPLLQEHKELVRRLHAADKERAA